MVGAWALAVTAVSWMGQPKSSQARPGTDPVSTAKVVEYIRERFGIPNAVKMTIEPFHDSKVPGFEETTLVVDDGKDKKLQPVCLTKDGRYLALGTLVTLGADPRTEIVKHIRETFKVPGTATLTAGPLVKSKYVEFHQTSVTLDDGKNKRTQDFYLTRDDKVAVLGSVFELDFNLRRKALDTMVLRNQASVGPTTAPVTIVEYADLECPMCAKFHDFLEHELLPRYGNKVRLVFKEFPLPMHDWSRTAAIANQCVYQLNPSAYLPYRSLVFAHQGGITVNNVRDAMLQYGDEVGVDRLKLAGCIDSQASLGHIEENKREAEALGINSTPTSFINGRMVVGAPPPEQYFALVDEALRGGK
jgi:protein-disulfide isomerase